MTGALRQQSLLITGTDTGVGKTTVACGLAAALAVGGLRVGVFKPAETGCLVGADGQCVGDDARRLQFFARSAAPAGDVCPYALPEPLAPALAARRAGVRIAVETIVAAYARIAAAHDVTLVEGAGGLLVPLTDSLTFADLAVRLRLPVVLVVASRLGAINHALLTVRGARALGLSVLGYIVNFPVPADDDLAARTNVDVLTQWLGPPLGLLPYLGEVSITEADRNRLADVFRRHVRVDELVDAGGSGTSLRTVVVPER